MYQLADAGGLHTGPAEVVLSTRAGLDEDPVACWPSQPRTRHPHLPQPPSAPAARRPRVPLRFSAGAGWSGGDGGPWGLHLLPFLSGDVSGLIPVNFIDHTKRPVKQLPQGPVCLICCLQTMVIQQ